MMKRTKRFANPFSGYSEKQRIYLRKFNWAIALLALNILIIGTIAWGTDYELGRPDPEGFLIWFLLFFAYLPLEIFGVISYLTGISPETINTFLTGNEAPLLGLCDLFLVLGIYLVVRFWVFRKQSLDVLKLCTVFVRVFVVWGWFQLSCFGAVSIWNKGGLAPLHQHLHRPSPPEKVIIVTPQNTESKPQVVPRSPKL